MKPLGVLVQGCQFGTQHMKSLSKFSQFKELQIFLLSYAEPHGIPVSSFHQDQAIPGSTLRIRSSSGAEQKLLGVGPSALYDSRPEGCDRGALQLVATIIANALGGRVISHIREGLNQEAGDFFSIVAKIRGGGGAVARLLLSILLGGAVDRRSGGLMRSISCCPGQ